MTQVLQLLCTLQKEMAEMAEQNLKFDCPEGLISLDEVKCYDFVTNDEFMKSPNDENGVCVHITIQILDGIINEEEKPYLWKTYHLYTPKRLQDKLEGKIRFTCIGYLKGKG